MAAETDAKIFSSLFADIYQHFYRRMTPGEFRVSPESLAVMLHLNQSGPLTVMEAAAHFSRSQSAMSDIFERLEKRNLLQRIPDERDRRRHLVWLTPSGIELLRNEQDVLSLQRLDAAMNTMTEIERKALFDGMRALLNSAHSLKTTPFHTSPTGEEEMP